MAVVALPSNAAAAPCPVNPGNATAWIGGSGSFNNDANWSNGGPSSACDVTIATAGSDVITMTAGANAKSFTLGGTGSTPQLIISAQSPNTNLDAQPAGITIAAGASVTLTCPPSPGECLGGSSGGAHISAGASPFANAGTIRVDSNSGTGAVVDGVIANTGSIVFEKSGSLGGKVTNKGLISVGDGATVLNWGSSCGDTGPFVKNDTGGVIGGTGTGVLSVRNFEQGDGTTEDVTVPCGTLKYSGDGASLVQVNAIGTPMTGNIASGQTLRVVGGITSGPFANAGTIVLDQSATNPTLDTGTLANAGRIELTGASANSASVSGGQIEQIAAGAEIVVPTGTKLNPGAPVKLLAGTLRGGGTIAGSVQNLGGTVEPGASPGTLALTGSYVQGVGGRLEIEVAGTGAGQFDLLSIGDVATLDGTLALVPTGSFPDSSAVGQSFSFLTYGSSLDGGFAATTVAPALSCPKQLTVSGDTGAKALKATVTDSGAGCGGTTSPPATTPPPPVPNTKLGVHPGPRVTTKLAKLKIQFGFSSDVAGATFQCKIDRGSFKPCRSPKTFKVKPGKHRFSVRAVAPGGTDATPATYKFKVIRQKG